MSVHLSSNFKGQVALFYGPEKPLKHLTVHWQHPGAGEVLVKIRRCAVCRSDVHTVTGRRSVKTPTVLGHEIIGDIVALHGGEDCEDIRGQSLRLGDRITWAIYAHCGQCFYCRHQLPQKCENLFKYGHEPVDENGQGSSGGMADFILLKRGTPLLKLPDSIPDNTATPINCAMATAAALLRESGVPYVRQASIVVMGGGYAGLSAVAMAKDQGAHQVIVCEPNTDLHKRCKSFGADWVFKPEHPLLRETILQQTEGRGADLVLELAGSSDAAELGLGLLRIGGKLMLAGTVFPSPAIALDPEYVVRHCLNIQGVHNYHPNDLITATAFLENQGMDLSWDPLVGQSYPLKDLSSALEASEQQPGLRMLIAPNG